MQKDWPIPPNISNPLVPAAFLVSRLTPRLSVAVLPLNDTKSTASSIKHQAKSSSARYSKLLHTYSTASAVYAYNPNILIIRIRPIFSRPEPIWRRQSLPSLHPDPRTMRYPLLSSLRLLLPHLRLGLFEPDSERLLSLVSASSASCPSDTTNDHQGLSARCSPSPCLPVLIF